MYLGKYVRMKVGQLKKNRKQLLCRFMIWNEPEQIEGQANKFVDGQLFKVNGYIFLTRCNCCVTSKSAFKIHLTQISSDRVLE